MLTMIHKFGYPVRPIVPACPCPTERLPDFLDNLIQPVVRSLPSCLTGTKHTVTTFDSFNLLPNHLYHIFLLDVCSLYTFSPNADGLRASRHFFDLSKSSPISTSTHYPQVDRINPHFKFCWMLFIILNFKRWNQSSLWEPMWVPAMLVCLWGTVNI